MLCLEYKPLKNKFKKIKRKFQDFEDFLQKFNLNTKQLNLF